MNFFYPEEGKLTLTNVVPPAMPVPDKSTNPHSQNVRLWKLWHEDLFRWKLRGNLYSTMPGTQ